MNEELHRKLAKKPDCMDTRDMFAAAVVSGVLGNSRFNALKADELAAIAYEVADAMIEERSK